jgi:hypothetical protein
MLVGRATIRRWLGVFSCLYLIVFLEQTVAGVSAAPNRILLSAEVISLGEPVNSKRKLRARIESVKCLSGPCFAEQGQQVDCFTFLDASHLVTGTRFKAEAEYIGGPHRGVYQLLEFVDESK